MAGKYDENIGNILVRKGVLSKEKLNDILKEISSSRESLSAALSRKNIIEQKEIMNILAGEFGLSVVDLGSLHIDDEVIKRIPARIAFYYNFIPLEFKDNSTLIIAVAYPFDVKTQDELMIHIGCSIKIVLASEDDISNNLKRYYGLGADTLDKISLSVKGTARPVSKEVENIEELAEDASIMKLVNQIIFEAYKRRATDIHIEPFRKEVSIRYRIDGVLYDANVSSDVKRYILPIISRIKIMCNLNIVEKRLPQDGRAVVKTHDQTLDLRISTLPTPYGESMVIRILPSKMLFSLEGLGLSDNDLNIINRLIARPNGIIFITGPTGSGKTTTLYAALSKLNTRNRKIVTIEDPIEYELKGITQIQVKPEIGLTFAYILRGALRQSPDILMVGEIRDIETADVAMKAALTGHLVLATLHTNEALSAITRLLDMGVEPFLVIGALRMVSAQRLVRKLCSHCREPYSIRKEDLEKLSICIEEDEVNLYKARGCSFCNNTGYKGREVIVEAFLADNTIKEMIFTKKPLSEIRKYVASYGMKTLREDGFLKVLSGDTSLEEVIRITTEF